MRQFTELKIANCQRAQHLPIELTDLETNLLIPHFLIQYNLRIIKQYYSFFLKNKTYKYKLNCLNLVLNVNNLVNHLFQTSFTLKKFN